VNLVFLGTTSFGIPALESLMQAGHVIKGVVSTPASGKGRGQKIIESDITAYAKEKGLGPILTPQSLKNEEFVHEIKQWDADVFIVVAFRILPVPVFTIPSMGTYNIHASLLPKYRGPAPINRAIEAGEKETGITIFKIDQGVDTGNIVLQRRIPIDSDVTAPQMSVLLSKLGAQGIVEALEMIEKGTVVLEKQENGQACPAPKLVKAEGALQWSQPAQVLYDKVRAFKPFPGTWTFLNGQRLVIEEMRVMDSSIADSPGAILSIASDGLDIACGKGVVRILRVKPEGKKSMSATDFANGRNIQKGTILT
jgi:methionyl-tRNA formyltransferase